MWRPSIPARYSSRRMVPIPLSVPPKVGDIIYISFFDPVTTYAIEDLVTILSIDAQTYRAIFTALQPDGTSQCYEIGFSASPMPYERVINDEGNRIDLRVESMDNQSAVFMDGNTGHLGIHTRFPVATVDIQGDLHVRDYIVAAKVDTISINTGHLVITDETGVPVVTINKNGMVIRTGFPITFENKTVLVNQDSPGPFEKSNQPLIDITE